MDLATILYTLIIKPLVLIFEVIFVFANRGLNNPGLCIIVLSLAMNLLVLPIYHKADVIQKEERNLEEKMSGTVAHIKKVFKGDERFMILQTYYRQNNYSPLYTLKSLLPVILQIPFSSGRILLFRKEKQFLLQILDRQFIPAIQGMRFRHVSRRRRAPRPGTPPGRSARARSHRRPACSGCPPGTGPSRCWSDPSP